MIYVWIEAPVGYISATKELFIAKKQPDKWKDYWCNENTKLVQFLGKDNIIFHAIVFPAMLMAHEGFKLPDDIPANEFLNLEGEKFSKSRGHSIDVKDIIKKFNPDTIRYAIASNLPENRDTDFYWKDLQTKNNNELAAILGNFINRTFVFAEKYFNSAVPQLDELKSLDKEILEKNRNSIAQIAERYENFKFKDAVTETMNIVRDANKYFNDSQPWAEIKNDKLHCESVINVCLQLVHSFAILFNPIIPFSSDKMLQMLNKDRSDFTWEKATQQCLKSGHKLNKPEILFTKIEDSELLSF
jgi:methionyl-tRNA synthetase